MPEIPSDRSPSFELKGEMSMLTVFRPLTDDLDYIRASLAEKTAMSADFFRHLPVVIDLQGAAPQALTLVLGDIASVLRDHGLVPIGVRGLRSELEPTAIAAGLGILHSSGNQLPRIEAKAKPEEPKPAPVTHDASTVLIERPVRSGQQVVAPHGDLVIVGAASAGSELLAAGSIHVYGTLRGRALAGVNGNREARIFCLKLEAELLSIAGCYQLLEQRRSVIPGPVKVSLEQERLRLDSI